MKYQHPEPYLLLPTCYATVSQDRTFLFLYSYFLKQWEKVLYWISA